MDDSAPPIRLRFDRGTLVLADVPLDVDLTTCALVRYDARIDAWRGRACDRDALLRALRQRRLDVVDQTARPLPGPAGPPAIDLRPYQEAALHAWTNAAHRGVLVLPTGAGKTRIALAAIVQVAVATLVLVPTKVLLEQWADELARAGIGPVGRWGDRRQEPGAVVVATMDAAWWSMHKLGDAFELIVVDEVHRMGEARSEALEMAIARRRLGLTATLPDPVAMARIERLVGPVVHRTTIEDLAGTFLAPFDLEVVAVELTAEERADYDRHMGVFRAWLDDQRFLQPACSFDALMGRAPRTAEGRQALDAQRRARAVCTYPAQKRVALAQLIEQHRARKVLVFTPNNKTAYAVAREHLITPVTCDVPRAERARILQRFKDGTIRALVSSAVLNEGVDVPDADTALVVGGRAGEREHVQRVGRVLRPVAGKRALVVELVAARTSEMRAGDRRRAAFRR